MEIKEETLVILITKNGPTSNKNPIIVYVECKICKPLKEMLKIPILRKSIVFLTYRN